MAEHDQSEQSIWRRELKGPFWDLFEKLALLGCGCEFLFYLVIGVVALVGLISRGCER